MKHSPYSNSRLDACLLRFKRHYIDKLEPTIAKTGYNLGLCYHEFIARYLTGETNIAKVGTECLEKYPTVRGEDFWEIASRTPDSNLPSVGDLVFVEEKIAIDENEELCDFWDKNALYRGVIDLAIVNDDDLLLIDHKTSPRILPDGEIIENTQLLSYAYLMLKKGDFENITIGIHYPRYNLIKKFKVSKEAINKAWKNVLYSIYEHEHRDTFPAQPGGECSFCGYSDLCESERKEELPEVTAETISDVVKEQILLANRASVLMKQLKEYVAENGNVDCAQFVAKENHVIEDLQRLHLIIVSHGVDPWKYFNATNKNIKQLIRDHKKMRPEVQKLITKKITTQFRLG